MAKLHLSTPQRAPQRFFGLGGTAPVAVLSGLLLSRQYDILSVGRARQASPSTEPDESGPDRHGAPLRLLGGRNHRAGQYLQVAQVHNVAALCNASCRRRPAAAAPGAELWSSATASRAHDHVRPRKRTMLLRPACLLKRLRSGKACRGRASSCENEMFIEVDVLATANRQLVLLAPVPSG